MPASSIAQIFLRLLALFWMITGVIEAANVIFIDERSIQGAHLLSPIGYLVFGMLLWYFALPLSRLLTKGNDGECSLEGVTQQQLFATTILGIGLYFTIDSFASVFSWIHFFAVRKKELEHMETIPMEFVPSYYDLAEACLMLGAGLFCIFLARRWAAMLCRNGRKGSAEPPRRDAGES